MSNPTQAEIEQARTQALELGRRARADQAYLQQLIEDPVGTMLAAGLPPGAVVDILAEEGVEGDEVQGYIAGLSNRANLAPSLGAAFGALGRGGALSDCGGAFSCLCASASGCCYTTGAQGPGMSTGTASSPKPF